MYGIIHGHARCKPFLQKKPGSDRARPGEAGICCTPPIAHLQLLIVKGSVYDGERFGIMRKRKLKRRS
jgi:hypothetical protein